MKMQKKIIQVVKFNLAVGDAKPGPHLAPILGQSQINLQAFCKEFIELTSKITEGIVLPVRICKYEDKSFKIFYKAPTINYIYEQIVLNRQSNYLEDFSVITIYELLDVLKIMKSFLIVEGRELQSDRYYVKVILAFLKTKRVRVINIKKKERI